MKALITATAMLTVVTLLVALCVNVRLDFLVMVSHALVSIMLLDIVQALINSNRIIPHDLRLKYLMNNVYFSTTSIRETIIVDKYLCI